MISEFYINIELYICKAILCFGMLLIYRYEIYLWQTEILLMATFIQFSSNIFVQKSSLHIILLMSNLESQGFSI